MNFARNFLPISIPAFILASGISLSGCQGDERITEVSSKETQAQLEQERIFSETRSIEMENDLAKRQAFYQAVAGTYEGTMTGDRGAFQVRIILVPSLPPYVSTRVRLPEEVASDLNSLYLNVQIVQWTDGNLASASGCRLDQVRPDMREGRLHFSSTDCPNFYALQISDGTFGLRERGQNQQAVDRQSSNLAGNLLNGNSDPIQRLFGEMQPTTYAGVYTLTVNRVR